MSETPDYDFRPNPAFNAALGDRARFVVVNPFDLMLQEQGLMADALVVEAIDGDGHVLPLWFRYNAVELSSKGSAECTLFWGEAGGNLRFEGACGVLFDRRRA